MKQDIIINATISETRIALLENDILVELHVERPENERMVGNIYKGIIRKVMPSISAAFIDIGLKRDAFLHFSDIGGGNGKTKDDDENQIDRDNSTHKGRKHWNPSDLKVGKEILVQVVKEPIGRKGPRVTSYVSLPGRGIVLVINDSFVGVSRKITNYSEKRRLKSIVSKFKPKGFGIIIRTLAEEKSDVELEADLKGLVKNWQKCEQKIRNLNDPGIVHRDASLASSTIRDLFSPDVDRLIVDSRKLYNEIVNYVDDVAPNLTDRVQLYREKTPVFDKYKIESEIEKCLSRKIWLTGGGYLYFDQTEALIAIDVNSGRFAGKKDHEENSLKVNLAAAKEISRQLRLRDIGGIIVIDFIDLLMESNRRKVFDEMRHALRMDRARWDIAPIGPFGVMEMTRQRIRPSLLYTFRESCPNCDGTGLVPSMVTVVTTLERWIKRFTSRTRERRLLLTLNPEVRAYLTGGLSSRIARIMWGNKVYISIETDEELKIDQFKAYSPKLARDVTDEYMVRSVSRKD
ncbi:MAG: Rne/Rng family ribonuclease [Calditrichaeota bacterium]|nr:Rne/Rng family ribonuclease [Calditrichota bacterium]